MNKYKINLIYGNDTSLNKVLIKVITKELTKYINNIKKISND